MSAVTHYVGTFMYHLIIAAVKQMYNKGDKTIMQNCTHISLLTVFSKIFHTAVYSRSCHLPHTNNILVSDQRGFSRQMSTKKMLP